MKAISLGFDGMTLADLTAIARGGAQAKLTEGSEKRIRATRRLVENGSKMRRPFMVLPQVLAP